MCSSVSQSEDHFPGKHRQTWHLAFTTCKVRQFRIHTKNAPLYVKFDIKYESVRRIEAIAPMVFFFSCKGLCEIKPQTIQSGGIHDVTLEVIKKNLVYYGEYEFLTYFFGILRPGSDSGRC